MSKTASVLFILLVIISCTRHDESVTSTRSPFLSVESAWVDSMLIKMTLEEKIGQLIFLKTKPSEEISTEQIFQWNKKGMFGGILLENFPLDQFLSFHDTLQMMSPIPLFNGTQASVVLNNQISDAVPFPMANSIAAIQNDTIQAELETLYLKQCEGLSINFCLSPSLSSDFAAEEILNEKEKTDQHQKIFQRLENLNQQKILSIGNSFRDYYEMPIDTAGYLDSLLLPHHQLVKSGLSGYFVDSSIFQLDSIENLQTFFLKNYLQQHTDFDGLLIGEVSSSSTVDELLHAGIDIFVIEENVKTLFDYLYKYISDGLISEKVLNEKVRKILMAKTYLGFHENKPLTNRTLAENTIKNDAFKFYAHQLFERSIVLANNYNNLLPFTKTYRRDFRLIHSSESSFETFKTYFSKYSGYSSHKLNIDDSGQLNDFNAKYYKHSTPIVLLDNLDLNEEKYTTLISTINQLSKDAKLTLVNFGNPYNLQHFDSTMTQVQVFEKNKGTESFAAQLLFGGVEAKGHLPFTITPHLQYQKSIKTPITRLKYTIPQEVGITPEKLVGIDVIMKNAINEKATPGGQIMVVKNGKVIYDKSFGHHTYDKVREVRSSDLFDIASVSKIAATTVASMKIFEEKKFKLNDRVKSHISVNDKSTLRNIYIKQLFTHASGLQANWPISKYYLNKDSVDASGCNEYFCPTENGNYTIQVAPNMFFAKNHVDSMWAKVEGLKLKRRGRFKYSDVNFNLIHRMIEEKTSMPMDKYLAETFYKPLNMRRTTFNPLEKFKPAYIVPTSNDDIWRKNIIQGYVHDESAAMLGGVAGNAGLFSTANDLAVLFQMMLNGGNYGETKYLEENTIKQFTTPKYGNHRGLGFVVKGTRGASALSKKASSKTYGHTGFTGTCVWVDPKHDLIFIFLSNRIHPDATNRKLFKKQVRRRIHDVIYQALDTYDTGQPSMQKVLVEM